MTPKAVIDHFGGIRFTARALGVTTQCVYLWLQRKAIPKQRQYQIEVNTGGRLKATP